MRPASSLQRIGDVSASATDQRCAVVFDHLRDRRQRPRRRDQRTAVDRGGQAAKQNDGDQQWDGYPSDPPQHP
jgi:hypothetical protein